MTETAVGLALAAAAALAYWLGFAGREGQSALRSGVKTAGVALLALTAAAAGAPWPVTLGLALGAAGDLALSRPGQGWFLAGMAAFAGGHLAYAWAFAGAVLVGAAPWPGLPLLPLLALGLLLVSTEAWLAPRTGALRGPVRGYVVVIGLMAVAALLIPPVPGRAWVQAGVVGFVLSDLILALRLFVLTAPRAQRMADLVLWPLYAGGQGLILWGALALSLAPASG